MAHFKLKLAKGERLLDRILGAGIALDHECDGALACGACRVIVRTGAQTLSAAGEDELDMLDRVAAEEPGARLACQALADGGEVEVELPATAVPARAAGSIPLSVTERASKFLAAQLARHPGAVAVRLAVHPSGCSGFRYRVDPADSILEGDRVFESGGVRVTVDALSLPYLQGTVVDVVQEGLARRLRFDNPNARQSCGCGASFGT